MLTMYDIGMHYHYIDTVGNNSTLLRAGVDSWDICTKDNNLIVLNLSLVSPVGTGDTPDIMRSKVFIERSKTVADLNRIMKSGVKDLPFDPESTLLKFKTKDGLLLWLTTLE